MSSGSAETLLALENVVLTSADGARTWAFDVSACGPRVTLIGDFSPLFALLSGELQLSGGSARIGSLDARRAVAAGLVGLMRCDATLPGAWTSQRYLEESASLGGRARPLARELARQTLQAFEIQALGSRRLGTLSVAERRLLLLANAALLAPKILVCERPLDRLETDSAERVSAALEHAARGRWLLASLAQLPPLGHERALADRSDTLIVLESGSVTFTGPPSGWMPNLSLISVTVSDNWEAFGAALRTRGLCATSQGFVDALHVLEPPRPGARFFRFLVELPAGTRNDSLFEASLTARAPIVELTPISSGS